MRDDDVDEQKKESVLSVELEAVDDSKQLSIEIEIVEHYSS